MQQAQVNINSFLMSELRKMREEQKRLHEEILALKLQNMQLSSRVDAIVPTNYIGSSSSQKGMVVFDLLKQPAIVLTANDTFCQMLGYEMVH